MQQDDLRDRLIRLFGSRDLHRTTLAMDDAARRQWLVTDRCGSGLVPRDGAARRASR